MTERLPFDEAVMAAAGYRRAGMNWRDIGHLLHHDKDRLRTALGEQNLSDGWGDSAIRSVGGGFATMGQGPQSK